MPKRLNDTSALVRRGIVGPDPLNETGAPVPFGVGLGVVMGSSSFSRASQQPRSGRTGAYINSSLADSTDYLCQGSTTVMSKGACNRDGC